MKSRNASNRRRELQEPPNVESLLLGPPPIMNMTNPLSDPAFNETYQHYLPTNSPSQQVEDDDATDPSSQVDDDVAMEEDNSHVIMNMTNPLSDPEFNYTYQHSSDHATMGPHSSPAKNKTSHNHHPSITISDPSPPTTTDHKSCPTNAGFMRRMICQTTTFSQNHPYFAVLMVGAVGLGIMRFVRNRRRSMSRGEYRAVAAHYIDNDFDDSFRDDDFSQDFLDDEEDEGWSTGKRTIEMASFGDEGGLTLEEVNG
jgi:hypothetical protein